MTRDRSGRGPGSSRRTGGPGPGRSGNPKAAAGGGGPRGGGSRVTPKGTGSDQTGPRRSRLVRVAALVFVALVLVAFVIACAPYDGDQAAFCDHLERAPSFAELSAQVEDGTDAEAQAAVARAADQFRAMERSAPRTIRHTVSALGDSADRIADDLAPGRTRTQVVRVPQVDGGVEEITIPADHSRISAFYRELEDHRGTITAVYDLMSYAHDDCGITEQAVDLGMVGFGSPVDDDGGFLGGGSPDTGPDGEQPPVMVDPPARSDD